MPGSCQPTKGCKLDATHISPDGSRLRAASSAPAWPADASTVASTNLHQACLVRPTSRQPAMCQTTSLAQQQLFFPLRRIEAIEFLSTEPPPSPSRAPRRCHGRAILLCRSAATQEREPRAGSATPNPTGAQHREALFKRSKSKHAKCVPKLNEKGAKPSEMVLIIQRLPNKAARPEAFQFSAKQVGDPLDLLQPHLISRPQAFKPRFSGALAQKINNPKHCPNQVGKCHRARACYGQIPAPTPKAAKARYWDIPVSHCNRSPRRVQVGPLLEASSSPHSRASPQEPFSDSHSLFPTFAEPCSCKFPQETHLGHSAGL